MTHTTGSRVRQFPSARASSVSSATRSAALQSFDATSGLHDLHFTEEQKRVLDCLQGARHGLTLKQIEKYSSGSPDGVQAALDLLVRSHLVCELNTVIPSYSYRYPGVRLYDE